MGLFFSLVSGTYLTYTTNTVPAIPGRKTALVNKACVSGMAAIARLGARTSGAETVS